MISNESLHIVPLIYTESSAINVKEVRLSIAYISRGKKKKQKLKQHQKIKVWACWDKTIDECHKNKRNRFREKKKQTNKQ